MCDIKETGTDFIYIYIALFSLASSGCDNNLIGSALSVLLCMCIEAAFPRNPHQKQLDMAAALRHTLY